LFRRGRISRVIALAFLTASIALGNAVARYLGESRLAEVISKTKILEGNAKDVIVEEAREWRADLIVVGSHGYGRLRRIVLGSVAGAVVPNAPCSVQGRAAVGRDRQHGNGRVTTWLW
jgi:nucleotide-binding universal stress UspA family protein